MKFIEQVDHKKMIFLSIIKIKIKYNVKKNRRSNEHKFLKIIHYKCNNLDNLYLKKLVRVFEIIKNLMIRKIKW